MIVSLESTILLAAIAATVILTITHALHRSRTRKENALVPDTEDLNNLEKTLDKIQEKRVELASANGHLSGRINALESSVREVGKKETKGEHIKKTLLEAREESEKKASPLLSE
ncbi:hypothetical protein ACFW3Z_06160 [Nocardiopsis alba]|jgi:predicted RNase H-like nuclease (RuvC/YqgF family)|uniref:hypothetical protein n=1 Tax=Nocardiopsis alba TaxID=53437 RepID=UPI0033A6AE81